MDGHAALQGENDGAALPSLLLEPLPQQIEVRAPDDDWTGLTDPTERRKLQNRLNQRAWRRRRTKQRRKYGRPSMSSDHNMDENILGLENGLKASTDICSRTTDFRGASQDFEVTGSFISVPMPRARQSATMCKLGLVEIGQMMSRFEELAKREYSLGSPRVDHLLTLVQFNVFRALLSNTGALGFTMEWLYNEDASSPFNTKHAGPCANSCPTNLHPTRLQCSILHHPWIDLFPIPTMRDNILQAGDSFDDTQLCMDLVEFIHSPSERTGLIVWDDPWDLRSWEVSEEFLKKWGWVIKDCHALFQSTNSWRMKRGEKLLFPTPHSPS